MRWGALLRGESRGLGNLTRGVHRALTPDRSLLVDMGPEMSGGFPIHDHWYPDATRVSFASGSLDEATVRDWLTGLDAVWTAETWYDDRIVQWAADANVRTICMTMPEFYRADGAQADVFWNPTGWRMEHLPPDTRLVPVPVELDRFAGMNEAPYVGPLRVLHNAGHRAAADRNGTTLFLTALTRMSRPAAVTVSGQDGRLPQQRHLPSGVTVKSNPRGQHHYWDVYADQDVLVIPRRYGGLCLPAQEGMAAGLAVVMPDVSPNREWPVVPVDCYERSYITCPGGDVPMVSVDPRKLAAVIGELCHPPVLAEAKAASRAWAAAHSWEALAPLWRDELARACR